MSSQTSAVLPVSVKKNSFGAEDNGEDKLSGNRPRGAGWQRLPPDRRAGTCKRGVLSLQTPVQPFHKLTAHELTSFGSSFPASCLRFECILRDFTPLR